MNNSNKKTALTRRQFIGRTAVGTVAVAITPFGSVFGENMLQTAWPANAAQFKFHMIGHAHIDPVWL